jgi:hypothetical protein
VPAMPTVQIFLHSYKERWEVHRRLQAGERYALL